MIIRIIQTLNTIPTDQTDPWAKKKKNNHPKTPPPKFSDRDNNSVVSYLQVFKQPLHNGCF